MSKDDRDQPRFLFFERATVITPDGKAYYARSENLSQSGIFLVTENPLPPGKRGLLVMTINTGKTKIDMTIHFIVTHNNTSRNGSKGMGVKFITVNDEDKEIIEWSIAQVSKKEQQYT